MNPRFKSLAKECGFVFRGNESHGPGPNHIDWSGDYQQEFEQYSQELVRWTIMRCESNQQAEHAGQLKKNWVQHTLAEFDLGPKIST